MKPTIGRIVIIHNPGGEQLAAIVTQVHNENCINCTAFIPNGNVSGFSSLNNMESCGNPETNTYWAWPVREN